MIGLVARFTPYALSFFSSLCIMILELVASRLVARHVGLSLTVWTSVIGIMLGGICLGNVLGGRLADRIGSRPALGPVYGLGAALTLGSLWVNSLMGLTAGLGTISWDLRTVVVVTLDYLVPATVLGMIGPVVAKMAVEQAARSGSALGDVYFWGAIGSIVGTFLAGFILLYLASYTTILILVAAALAALGAALSGNMVGAILGGATALLLGAGCGLDLARIKLPGLRLGPSWLNAVTLAGQVAAVGLAAWSAVRLARAPRLPATAIEAETAAEEELPAPTAESAPAATRTGLSDLAALSFVASLTFMALEMVAGRMVTRHLGSSVYGWTSVIGVLLGGLSLGNLIGGKVADRIRDEKRASWLFLAASALTTLILFLETPPTPPQWAQKWMTKHHWEWSTAPVLMRALKMTSYRWPIRVLIVVTATFLLPAVAMGTVSPVVAKLAVDRVRRGGRTGTAIGQVYAWGMVGSILGTFLTGFFLIDLLGTKGLVLVLGTTLALVATGLGTIWHAAWAGIPLGLCVIAFFPTTWFKNQGVAWGIREPAGDPATVEDGGLAYVKESRYYYIKIENEVAPAQGHKRTLVLDSLIHGYDIFGFGLQWIPWKDATKVPTSGNNLIVAGTDHDGLLHIRILEPGPDGVPGTDDEPLTEAIVGTFDKDPPRIRIRNIDPGPDRLRGTDDDSVMDTGETKLSDEQARAISALRQQFEGWSSPRTLTGAEKARALTQVATILGEARLLDHPERLDYDYEHIYALVTHRALQARARARGLDGPHDVPTRTLFLGGGSYTFPRFLQARYPGTACDVAEIDPAVTEANHIALGLPRNTTIHTTWGDARQFVERRQKGPKYDFIYGDAFNDFSVPWHLTTREFNDKLANLLAPDGVYMINIIDIYESDETAKEDALEDPDARSKNPRKARLRARTAEEAVAKARKLGGFLGSWVETARLTFPHLYVFGTHIRRGGGLRETFVIAASKVPLDLEDLGRRSDDPVFYHDGIRSVFDAYDDADMAALKIRSQGITLTDDYAPVENLLAPVAETRGKQED